MKKILMFVMGAMISFAMVACSCNNTTEEVATEKEVVEEVVEEEEVTPAETENENADVVTPTAE